MYIVIIHIISYSLFILFINILVLTPESLTKMSTSTQIIKYIKNKTVNNTNGNFPYLIYVSNKDGLTKM